MLFALALGLVPAGTARAQDGGVAATPTFTAEEAALLDVCDRFGWTEAAAAGPVAVHEWVGVDTTEAASDVPGFRDFWGWIVAERSGEVTILDAAGVRRTVRRAESPQDTGEAKVEPIAAEAAVERTIHPPKLDWTQSFDGPRDADDWTRRVIAAAQFRRATRDDLSRTLLASLEPWKEEAPLAVARGQVALRALWRVVVDFEVPEVTRSDLLRRLRVWDAAFRGTEHAAMAADLLREMERMVPEDDERARRPPAATEPTRAEQIAELIWLLRDCEMGHQIRLGPKSWRSIEREIRAFGWDAVPALIGALRDTRPSRAITAWRRFHFPGHRVLRVGDQAESILAQIGIDVGRSGERVECGGPGWDDAVARVEAWWRDVGSKGEAAGLRDLVQTLPESDWRRRAALRRLAEIEPAAALDRARALLAAAQTDVERRDAVDEIARLPVPEISAILREHLRPEESLRVRMCAALGLLHRQEAGAREALLAFLDEAATRRIDPDWTMLRRVVEALTRLDPEARDAVLAAVRRNPDRMREVVAGEWRHVFGDAKAPAVEGAARDFVADLALEVLTAPPLIGIDARRDGSPPFRDWDRNAAATVLSRLRGAHAWDGDAPPMRRLVAAQALVAAECAERKLPPPPAPRLVAETPLPPDAPPAAVASLSLAVGNGLEPDDAALAPLRTLLGREPDAAAIEEAVRGAFRARPKGCGAVALRLMRSGGPSRAEALFVPGRPTSQLTISLGHGDGFSESESVAHVDGPPMTDLEFPGWLRDRLAASVGRAAAGEWILDVRMTTE